MIIAQISILSMLTHSNIAILQISGLIVSRLSLFSVDKDPAKLMAAESKGLNKNIINDTNTSNPYNTRVLGSNWFVSLYIAIQYNIIVIVEVIKKLIATII